MLFSATQIDSKARLLDSRNHGCFRGLCSQVFGVAETLSLSSGTESGSMYLSFPYKQVHCTAESEKNVLLKISLEMVDSCLIFAKNLLSSKVIGKLLNFITFLTNNSKLEYFSQGLKRVFFCDITEHSTRARKIATMISMVLVTQSVCE